MGYERDFVRGVNVDRRIGIVLLVVENSCGVMIKCGESILQRNLKARETRRRRRHSVQGIDILVVFTVERGFIYVRIRQNVSSAVHERVHIGPPDLELRSR